MHKTTRESAAQCAHDEEQLRAIQMSMPAAPDWSGLRSRIVSKLETEEHNMGFMGRLAAGRGLSLRLALGLAALALLVGASLLLPFVRGAEHAPQLMAYSGGYVLVYDFGTSQPDEALREKGMAIVHEWQAANAAQGGIDLALNEDVVDGVLRISVSLIGATGEQAQQLVEALSVLPGLPAPTVSEASWYQLEAVEARQRDELFLYEFEHGFHFPRGTTGEQIEQALRDYLIERDGHCDVEIDVEVEWGTGGASVTVTTG